MANDRVNAYDTLIYLQNGICDPRVVALDAVGGTLFLLLIPGAYTLLQKQDNGKTTNWLPFPTGGGGGGAQVLYGAGAPAPSLGSIGDTYVDTTAKNMYSKTGVATWTLELNVGPGPAIYESFVFQPGGTAVNNTYTTWASLYSALQLTQGSRDIVFDATFLPCNIPAGTYSLDNVTFRGLANISETQVTCDNGVIFTSFPALTGGIIFTSNSAAPIYTVPVGGVENISLALGAGIFNFGTSAQIIDVPSTSTFVLLLDEAQVFGSTGFPAVTGHGTASLIVVLKDGAGTYSDTFAGDALTTLFFDDVSASGIITLPQTDFAGVITSASQVYLYGSTSNLAVTLTAAATSAAYPLVLPPGQGAPAQTLINDGGGNLSWGSAGGSLWGAPSTVFAFSANGNILPATSLANADATAGNIILNLPAPGAGIQAIAVSKIDASVNTVEIAGVIRGGNQILNAQAKSLTFISDLTIWTVL